jgi:two-component system sensor histidine kinase KdpD
MTTQEVRILACLGSSPTAVNVARRAKRLADLAGTSFEAVHVAAAGEYRAPQRLREALLQGFRTAETLGATTRTLNGENAAGEILAYARRQNVTHLVMAASSRPAWIEAFAPSTFRLVIEGAGEIAVEVCAPDRKSMRARLAEVLAPPPIGDPLAYVVSAGFVGVASMLAVPLQRTLALPNVSLIYVLAVIAAAARYGAAVAGFTAVLAALAYNFFLTEPYYSFQIDDPRNVWAVFFFLAVAIVVSSVASHTRAQTRIARRQAEQAAELQAFAHTLVANRDASEIAMTTVETISKLLYARAVVLAPGEDGLELLAETPGPEMLGADDASAARYAFDHQQEAGHGLTFGGTARWVFVPIPGERGPNGVLGARPFDDPTRLDPEQRRFLDMVADQAGLAFDRARAGAAAR